MIQIQKAGKEHLESIVDFQVRMAFETEGLHLDKEIVRSGVFHIFQNDHKGYYLIARVGEKVIASLLVLYEWSDWRNGNVIWVHSVYVLPGYREKGIFRKMYERMKQDVINDDNLKGIRLYVDKTNLNAQKVYKKLGMNDQHYNLFEWMESV
ncbi:MAG: GNAT family N-acetyltransferase [Bacteroidales bacterium]|nr:GNAT family N-acetyltransferase [Bacteroidales bacterium]